MDERTKKKIARKIKRCEEILFKRQSIKTTVDPTNSLFIGNGGFGCGFSRECLMDIFRPYGVLGNIVMVAGEPYAFVVYLKKADAISAMQSINGRSLESGQVLYMAYVSNSDVPSVDPGDQVWPPGLILLEDFINEEEEMELLAAIHSNEDGQSILKYRKVKHYGYEFIYGSNNIDKEKKLAEDIPGECIPHLERLVALGHLPTIPDQLTVNHYQPGHGIPPHIDTHSAFEDGIVSLSLGSQVVMEFYHPEKKRVSVLLPRRSILIMKGESRYLWKHGITPRKSDIAPYFHGATFHQTLCHRSTRVSLTFRIVLRGECHCEFKNQCDSLQNKESPLDNFVDNDEAQKLEEKYVNQVYEEIADHFSNTRYKPWPKVASFLASVEPGSFILDVGCGNGKNMQLSKGCFEVGCDASSNLAQVCLSRGMEVLIADCLRLPFRDASADCVICIAVIHHMAIKSRRSRAVQEILRVLSPGGRALVYVWAFEQETSDGRSKYIKKKKPPREEDDLANAVAKIEVCDRGASLPVHRNKTDFDQQDVLVPWKDSKSESVCHRFYHVFVEGELDLLVRESGGRVVDSYYDEGNWGVVFTK